MNTILAKAWAVELLLETCIAGLRKASPCGSQELQPGLTRRGKDCIVVGSTATSPKERPGLHDRMSNCARVRVPTSCTGGSTTLHWRSCSQLIYISQAKNLVIVRNGEQYGLPDEIVGWSDLLCIFVSALPSE